LFLNTFSSACARLAADATDSNNRPLSATVVQVAGSVRPLPFAVCNRYRFPRDSSRGTRSLSPFGLSASAKVSCRGPVLLNPSPPSLHRLSPASSPRALTGSRSCSWLTVASNRPCRGLAPPIGHSCSTYPVGLRPPSALSDLLRLGANCPLFPSEDHKKRKF